MAKKAANLAGYATPAARARRAARANSPKSLLAMFKFVGMSEQQQREFLEKAKAAEEQGADSSTTTRVR